ncbi:MAG: hypothetical protein HKN82_13450 [Akkermansiaceae bacterium]|nr:hypothetical protein [Akkermansiaceae bacterium]NNM28673.1 hypothetical protein [Akkermansiaceae bacterium]
MTAAAVVGSFALALVLVLRIAGSFGRAEAWLLGSYEAGGFGIEAAFVHPWWGILVAAAGAYGLGWILLETPGLARRILLTATVMVLTAMASVVLGLWGVFWSPVATMTAMLWSGFCAMVWAHQHPMPCEAGEEIAPRKVISIAEKRNHEEPAENRRKQAREK